MYDDKLSLIAAVAANGVIGAENRLLWHISEDLRHFKMTTAGHSVLMGRKTWESLGRPLPGRRNIVITRQQGYGAAGCEVVGSLDEALALCAGEEEVFVIGGGEVYRQALPRASRLYLTLVHREYEGDTFFPEVDPEEWTEVYRDKHMRGQNFEHPFSFVICRRKK